MRVAVSVDGLSKIQQKYVCQNAAMPRQSGMNVEVSKSVLLDARRAVMRSLGDFRRQ